MKEKTKKKNFFSFFLKITLIDFTPICEFFVRNFWGIEFVKFWRFGIEFENFFLQKIRRSISHRFSNSYLENEARNREKNVKKMLAKYRENFCSGKYDDRYPFGITIVDFQRRNFESFFFLEKSDDRNPRGITIIDFSRRNF